VTIDDTTHLASLGWDAGWAAAFRAAGQTFGDRSENRTGPGRVVAEHRERYTVSVGDGEVSAVLAGRARHVASARQELPAVGDWVGISRESGDGTAIVRFVVPRRSAFMRKSAGMVTEAQVVAANVDVALVVTALPGGPELTAPGAVPNAGMGKRSNTRHCAHEIRPERRCERCVEPGGARSTGCRGNRSLRDEW